MSVDGRHSVHAHTPYVQLGRAYFARPSVALTPRASNALVLIYVETMACCSRSKKSMAQYTPYQIYANALQHGYFLPPHNTFNACCEQSRTLVEQTRQQRMAHVATPMLRRNQVTMPRGDAHAYYAQLMSASYHPSTYYTPPQNRRRPISMSDDVTIESAHFEH